MKKGFLLLMIALSCWGMARFSHHQTKGFRLSKLQSNTTCLSHQHSPALTAEQKALLNQKFHYLGRGLQCFAFLSEDGQTVLKLFNNRYQNRLFWLTCTPLRPLFDHKIAYNQKKWALAFASYELAYSRLKEETGLLFFHPQPCTDCPAVTLVDPLNIEHRVDLSKTAYVLQEKAIMAYPYFDTCSAPQAERAIQSLVALMQKKMALGIADRDPLIRTNFGFVEGRAVQVDIGPFSLEKISRNQKEEITRITLSLKHWLESHHPEYVPYLYEAIENL